MLKKALVLVLMCTIALYLALEGATQSSSSTYSMQDGLLLLFFIISIHIEGNSSASADLQGALS